MPVSELIRTQTTPEDGALLLTGYQNSMFAVREPKRASDRIREKLYLDHADTVAGRSLKFEIEKTATYLDDLRLECTLPALAVPGDGTFIRYPDFPLWQAIESIEYKFGSNHIATFTPESNFLEYLQATDERKECIEVHSQGGLTPAQRNTRAIADQKVQMWLPSPWRFQKCHDPVISALANKLAITIKLRGSAYMYQTDGTKPANLTYSGIKLFTHVVHVVGSERAEVTSLTLAPNGLSYLFKEELNSVKSVDVGKLSPANWHVIDLIDFTGPIASLHAIIRKESDIDPLGPEPKLYEIDGALLQDVIYNIRSSNKDVQEETDANIELAYDTEKYYSSGPAIGHLRAHWDEYPEMLNCASGHISFGNLNNPQFRIKGPANAERLEVTFTAFSHNWLNHQGGNLQAVWN